ncbi:TylF/MycF/NovP-related O-methyltransferase [Ensifer sp. BR816]|uniref:TylF/MycF/NovP-related O-methyltransferase n=1 Tax=Rhizobium sp. (strain BR816) TaxID=1057002 RepID=UPI000368BE7F|nr:TylF/MycF/NovP-related O-methyltransferase [Ensifer sp. BR816]
MGIREFKRRFRFLVSGEESLPGYQADGFRVTNKNIEFMKEPKFAAAWRFSEAGNREAWAKRKRVPDVRWRAHTCCFAAQRALKLDGDFVEFGVNAGLLSMTVCEYLDFGSLDRKFWLFDTFAGIPEGKMTAREAALAKQRNVGIYFDVYNIAKRNFAKFQNAVLVKGFLPQTLDGIPISKIAYLSIDLNVARYEKECIDRVWDKVVPGASIVLDDYAFVGCEEQNAMWNEFAAVHGQSILTLPTGQGLMIKQ